MRDTARVVMHKRNRVAPLVDAPDEPVQEWRVSMRKDRDDHRSGVHVTPRQDVIGDSVRWRFPAYCPNWPASRAMLPKR